MPNSFIWITKLSTQTDATKLLPTRMIANSLNPTKSFTTNGDMILFKLWKYSFWLYNMGMDAVDFIMDRKAHPHHYRKQNILI